MARRNRILDLFLLLLIQLHLIHGTATCYEPDGTAVTDPRYKPCIAIENEFSMCCRLNDTNPDLCYPNGLCYWTAKNQYWRNFCTDQTWESPNCIPNTTCNAAVSLVDKLARELVPSSVLILALSLSTNNTDIDYRVGQKETEPRNSSSAPMAPTAAAQITTAVHRIKNSPSKRRS